MEISEGGIFKELYKETEEGLKKLDKIMSSPNWRYQRRKDQIRQIKLKQEGEELLRTMREINNIQSN